MRPSLLAHVIDIELRHPAGTTPSTRQHGDDHSRLACIRVTLLAAGSSSRAVQFDGQLGDDSAQQRRAGAFVGQVLFTRGTRRPTI
jgi:hypothetical protein